MSHRNNCPSRWEAEDRARFDYDYYGREMMPSSYYDCHEAYDAYQTEIRRQEEEAAYERRRAEQRRMEEYYREQEERRWYEQQQEEEAQYEAWLAEQEAAFWADEQRFSITEEGRWADDGGAIPCR